MAATPVPANCLAVLNAINSKINANTLTNGICPQATSAGSSSQTAVTCYLANVPGASMVDFANHGLDSGAQFLGGYPAPLFGLTPQTGAVFGGVRPNNGAGYPDRKSTRLNSSHANSSYAVFCLK